MKRILGLAAATLLASAPAFAQHHQHAAPAKEGATAAAAKDAFAEGEVKKVDKSAGKVTLKHGPIASLDMPPMTMVFRVKDAAMLDKVKAGDNVKFKAANVNGALTVTEISK